MVPQSSITQNSLKSMDIIIQSGMRKKESRQLEIAIETHKDNFLLHRERDREKLWEFHPDNPKNIQGYVDLVENALAKHLRK